MNLLNLYLLVTPKLTDPNHNLCYNDVLTDLNYIVTYIATVLPTMSSMDQVTAQMTVNDISNFYKQILLNFNFCNSLTATTTSK